MNNKKISDLEKLALSMKMKRNTYCDYDNKRIGLSYDEVSMEYTVWHDYDKSGLWEELTSSTSIDVIVEFCRLHLNKKAKVA